jgi:antitoxin (DNA-binding transcriptional repressor) of toxin-antitoxin stability system
VKTKSRSLEEVRRELPQLVDAARNGEVVNILLAGEPVAAIVPSSWITEPPPEAPALSPEDRLISRMEAEGLLVRNRHMPDPGAVDELPDRPSGVLDALFEERDENW